RYFRRSDGNCNLAIAYMVAFAAKIDNLGPSVKKHLDQVLADENLSADQRVTWLLARAYVQEVANWEMPKPDLGIAYTEEAFAQAESDPVRFWALRELMV